MDCGVGEHSVEVGGVAEGGGGVGGGDYYVGGCPGGLC